MQKLVSLGLQRNIFRHLCILYLIGQIFTSRKHSSFVCRPLYLGLLQRWALLRSPQIAMQKRALSFLSFLRNLYIPTRETAVPCFPPHFQAFIIAHCSPFKIVNKGENTKKRRLQINRDWCTEIVRGMVGCVVLYIIIVYVLVYIIYEYDSIACTVEDIYFPSVNFKCD